MSSRALASLVSVLLPFAATAACAAQAAASAAAARKPAWKLLHEETFEDPATTARLSLGHWVPDTFQNTDEFSDGGSYFQKQGIQPPTAFRIEETFGKGRWLTVASYSRSSATPFNDLVQVVPDPFGGTNHVLKVASPLHTDGTVVRPTVALPSQYRACLNVGFAAFGDGKPGGLNGYAGGEKDEPWSNGDATLENGFYWLTILDDTPRPHNNLWIHHHRKVTIDSDNNKESWTNIWEGKDWIADGQHPVMMFGTAAQGNDEDSTGRPFLSWSNGALQPAGLIRAVDAYKDNTWYHACVERNATSFVLTVSGDFKWGGRQTYTGTIPLSLVYATGAVSPDFFMFGDPHNNYYRGAVYYDDIRLETLQEAAK